MPCGATVVPSYRVSLPCRGRYPQTPGAASTTLNPDHPETEATVGTSRPDHHLSIVDPGDSRDRDPERPGTDPDELLPVAQVLAELGNVPRRTFYRWRAIGRAPACLRLPNGELRVRRGDLAAWLDQLRDDHDHHDTGRRAA